MRILRGINGRVLPCGCLVGVYETYTGRIVSIVDARGSLCTNEAHRVDAPLPDEMPLSETIPTNLIGYN